MLGESLLDVNGKKYILKRIMKEGCFPEKYDVDLVKEFYHIDTILKKQGKLYLCNEIKDAEIIEQYIA